MLEMAILETQILKKIFLEACPQTPLESSCLRRSLVNPTPFENPGSALGPISVFNTLAALHSIFGHTGSPKLYVTMLIGYVENAVPLHLSLIQCLKLLIFKKRLLFTNSVVKIAVTIKM